jgi:hypothetical protein
VLVFQRLPLAPASLEHLAGIDHGSRGLLMRTAVHGDKSTEMGGDVDFVRTVHMLNTACFRVRAPA